MSKRRVVDLVIEQLNNWGVEHIYGYAGDTILDFLAAIKESPLELYTTKHEGAAGLMASAEAKSTGDLAVCVAHSGPGTANIINGLADAASDQAPLLLITGQVTSWNLGTNYKQYVNQLELTNPLTEFSSLVSHPDQIVDILVKAMTKAVTKGGVSHVVIPRDLWQQKTTAMPRQYPTYLDQVIGLQEELIQQFTTKITEASKPIILYGRGAKGCRKELLQLANKIKAGLIHTLPAKGIIEASHPLVLGGLGHAGHQSSSQLLKEADLIIMLGTTWWPIDYVPRQPRIIQIDATKDSLGKSYPVELGIVADLKPTLNLLVENISQQQRESWIQQVEKVKQEELARLEKKIESVTAPLDPQTVIATISEQASENEIFTLDSGDSVVWFGRYFRSQCQDVLVSGTWRTMGFGLPAALAAKINYPQAPVTCVIGDGGLGMVLAELLTAVRYDLPVRIIILNNSLLAMEKNKMLSANLAPSGVEMTNPDFVELAKSCGISGYRASNLKQLEEILVATKELDKPTVIDVSVVDSFPAGTKL